MASDLKMEIFAGYCFSNCMFEIGEKNTKVNILEIYGDECSEDDSYLSACDDVFNLAVFCRFSLFSQIYLEEVTKAKRMESLSEFYDYVTRTCDRDDLFGNLTVFERMLATFAFVAFFFVRIRQPGLMNVVEHGHIMWAMYFDKFTESFYEEGGWKEFKRVAESYRALFNFLHFFAGRANWLCVLKEASVNYIQFINTVKYDHCNKIHEGHISTQWVKFLTEHSEKYIVISPSYFYRINNFEIELLFQNLKFICNLPSKLNDGEVEILENKLHEKYYSTRMPHSKQIDNTEELNINDDLPFQNHRMNETSYDSLNCRKDLETLNPHDILIKMEVKSEIKDDIENFEIKRKSNSEMEILENEDDVNLDGYSRNECSNLLDSSKSPRFETKDEKSTNINDLDCNNKFTNKYFDNENKDSENIPKKIVKLHSQEINAEDFLSRNQNEKSARFISVTSDIPNLKEFCPQNVIVKNQNERKNSNSLLESSFPDKYEETYIENIEITETLPETKRDENAVSKKMSSEKDFHSGNEVMQDNEGRICNKMDPDELRGEQDDPWIRNFLRLILVLGDK